MSKNYDTKGISLPIQLFEKVKRQAAAEDMSFSAFCRRALRREMSERHLDPKGDEKKRRKAA